MKRTAVVVEVDDVIAGMICYFLELQAITCATVPSAEEALDLLDAAHPDLAIVDAALPGHDGWWLVEALRQKEDTPSLPLVVLTGQGDDAPRADRFACECVRKPFSYDQLNEGLSAAARRCASPAALDQ